MITAPEVRYDVNSSNFNSLSPCQRAPDVNARAERAKPLRGWILARRALLFQHEGLASIRFT
jgi:hypothetical protein